MCVGWLIKNFSQFNVIYYLLIIHVLILWLIYLLLLLRNNNLLCLLIRHVHHYIILCLHYILIHYSLRKQCGKLMLKFISRQDGKKNLSKTYLLIHVALRLLITLRHCLWWEVLYCLCILNCLLLWNCWILLLRSCHCWWFFSCLLQIPTKKKYIIPLNDLHENYMSMYVREANVERGSDVN